MQQPPRDIELGATKIANLRRFSHKAMNTVFELLCVHADAKYAEAAAWATFDRLASIEQDLSRFVENSDINMLCHAPAGEPVVLSEDAFDCLHIAAEVHRETGGAFDITLAAAADALKDGKAESCQPVVGRMGSLQLDTQTQQAALTEEGVQLDLGGIGKGFALEKMADVLREYEIETAMIHSTSTVLAMGLPLDDCGWHVTIHTPDHERSQIADVWLEDCALSGSGVMAGPHIVDPASGRAAVGHVAAWVSCRDAAWADALSTAFMVMPPRDVEEYCRMHPDTSAVVASLQDGRLHLVRWGQWQHSQFFDL